MYTTPFTSSRPARSSYCPGAKTTLPPELLSPFPGKRRLNFLRPAELFRPGGDVERMQALMIIPRAVLRHGHHVDGAMRAGGGVDHRRRGHADLRRHLRTAVVVAGLLTRKQSGHLPQDRASIGVDSRTPCRAHWLHTECCGCRGWEYSRSADRAAGHRLCRR